MLVVFLGPPGAGKGTQATRLKEHLKIPHLSTGEALREACQKGTEFGRQAAKYFEAGKLVPDNVVVGIVAERISQPDCEQGCLFDGFPRTVEQAKALDKMLEEQGRGIHVVLALDISQEQLQARLAQRGRVDDTEEAIRERLVQYEELTKPVTDYYRERSLVREVSGEGTVDEVFDRIRTVFDKEPSH